MKTTGPHEDTNHFIVSYCVLYGEVRTRVFDKLCLGANTADFDFGTFLGKATPTPLALRILTLPSVLHVQYIALG